MILLDTNVVSEAWKRQPRLEVVAWVDSQESTSLYLCTPVLAELRYGVERLPEGSRKERLRGLVDRVENDTYLGRILPLDVAAASEFGRLTVEREKAGRRMEPMDALIAAIALSNRMGLATRDIGDFSNLGLDLTNPFDFTA